MVKMEKLKRSYLVKLLQKNTPLLWETSKSNEYIKICWQK
jgi:hypothetical protein